MIYQIVRYVKTAIKAFFWLSLSFSTALCIYTFYHFETQLLGYQFTNPIYDYVKDMPVWLYIVLYFIIFSLISAFIFISLSHFFNVKKNRDAIIRERYSQLFIYMLTSYFISDYYNDEKHRKQLYRKIKPYLKTRIQVLALFHSYLRIQETLIPDLSASFSTLIKELKLQRQLEALIFNSDFADKILAMRILSYLQIRSREKQIVKCATSPNIALRTEAYAALLKLMNKDDQLLNFIGKKHRLSTLDINIVVNAILKNEKITIDFNDLLTSNNDQKLAIGLILLKHKCIKYDENKYHVIDHISSSNHNIKNLAWETLLTIAPEVDCINLILANFENETNETKLNILKNSHHIFNNTFSKYLAVIIEHQDLMIKIEAMKIIFQNDFDLLERFMSSSNDEIRMAYNEATCMYIL